VYLRHRWKNPPVKFGALQVGKVLSNGETNMPENSLFESKTDERGKEREN